MNDFLNRTWAEINLDNLRFNINYIKSIINNKTKIMAVVKADAYGHGDKYISKILEESNVDYFGVSNLEEAISLRNSGVKSEILIMDLTPEKFVSSLIKYNLTQTVTSLEYAEKLNNEASLINEKVKTHLKIDTGMGRLGLVASNNQDYKNSLDSSVKILSMSNLDFTGIFTHFAVADELNNSSIEYTRYQFEIFNKLCLDLEKLNFNLGIKHCCNSAATILYPEMHMDMVRPGIILYGIMPSKDVEKMVDSGVINPVMQLKSSISMVKYLETNSSISYGRRYITENKKQVATIPIGYADGYMRGLSNKAYMLLKGKKCSILGTICMDRCMIDIDNISANIGDVVTVFGEDNNQHLGVEYLADLLNTIPYELVCILGKRVTRVYYLDNIQIDKINFNNVLY